MTLPKELKDAIEDYALAKSAFANRFIDASNEDNRQYMMQKRCEQSEEGILLIKAEQTLKYYMTKFTK